MSARDEPDRVFDLGVGIAKSVLRREKGNARLLLARIDVALRPPEGTVIPVAGRHPFRTGPLCHRA